MRKVMEAAYAKVNLTLTVTGRRADGYHTIESLFQSVSLCDKLTLEQRERGFWLNETAGIPAEENIITRADRLLRREFPDILHQCKKYGNYDMVYEFASTSKITFPGDGVACMATSEANLEDFEKWIGIQTISYDKVNQQRHVLYLKDKAHTLELMKKHAAIMGPKFRCVVDALDREIAPLEIASWRRPKGGYFVSLNAMPGTARKSSI